MVVESASGKRYDEWIGNLYNYTWKEMGFFLPVWMATVPNWHRIHRHFVPPHASQISDGPRTVPDCSCPSRRPINANGRGVAAVQNIRPHRLNIPMETVGRPMVRWPVHVAMPPDIAPVLSSFAIVEIIPETKWKKKHDFLGTKLRISNGVENASFWWVFFSVHFSLKINKSFHLRQRLVYNRPNIHRRWRYSFFHFYFRRFSPLASRHVSVNWFLCRRRFLHHSICDRQSNYLMHSNY